MDRITYQPSGFEAGSFASKAARNAFIALVILFLSVYFGSERFYYYDPALYGYLWATVVSILLMVIRITAWTLRPPARRLWQQGFRLMRSGEGLKFLFSTFWNNIFQQKFVFKRSLWRGIQHFLIAWGVLLSLAITFALVLGWMHFELVDPRTYSVVFFGIPLFRMGVDSWLAFMIYHGLNWSGLMVLAGCIMALIRRVKDSKVLVEQGKEHDIFPLLLLLAVTVTGSLLTVSAMWMKGHFYLGIAIAHQITVIVFLLYLPFGKLWHLPLRFLALVVPMYHAMEKQKPCARCGQTYATATQIQDVQFALRNRNLSVPIENTDFHMSDLCSDCRRVAHRLAAYGAKVELGQSQLVVKNNGRNGLTLAQEGGNVHATPTER
ncbi:MFS transporter [Effusibacillus lacus]|uniref:MFS transporter n=1 Tax=Effusibacillus lacus TaxID=1348429 RepID=A0A292YS32_9BACL|nr:MFS transporter [Effusibacillus lacus]TCS76893.1 nitrate reductase gamma subunit [Effusibacillus lacus]GAX91224.1 MFS transporter [Effusibacillus lacus]